MYYASAWFQRESYLLPDMIIKFQEYQAMGKDENFSMFARYGRFDLFLGSGKRIEFIL